jgi:hypothetical protein
MAILTISTVRAQYSEPIYGYYTICIWGILGATPDQCGWHYVNSLYTMGHFLCQDPFHGNHKKT